MCSQLWAFREAWIFYPSAIQHTVEDLSSEALVYLQLAIAFCRCMNVPASDCTGYLGDIGVPPWPDPTDFCAWLEVYVGGRRQTLDPRNRVHCIGRVLIAQGRDAADVLLSNTFGPATLTGFRVWADELGASGA